MTACNQNENHCLYIHDYYSHDYYSRDVWAAAARVALAAALFSESTIMVKIVTIEIACWYRELLPPFGDVNCSLGPPHVLWLQQVLFLLTVFYIYGACFDQI